MRVSAGLAALHLLQATATSNAKAALVFYWFGGAVWAGRTRRKPPFRGPAQPIEMYQGADGLYYEDLQYVFAYQPGGWNKQLLAPRGAGDARRYGRVRAKGIAAGFGVVISIALTPSPLSKKVFAISSGMKMKLLLYSNIPTSKIEPTVKLFVTRGG